MTKRQNLGSSVPGIGYPTTNLSSPLSSALAGDSPYSKALKSLIEVGGGRIKGPDGRVYFRPWDHFGEWTPRKYLHKELGLGSLTPAAPQAPVPQTPFPKPIDPNYSGPNSIGMPFPEQSPPGQGPLPLPRGAVLPPLGGS
tara:strand:- start:931 stop:1353 length:423 start_codon:yes stop_codon:yes gene_type:complete